MEPILLIISIFAIFIGIFVQTVVGFAAGLITMPILLTVFSIQEATAIMSVFLLIFSAIQLKKDWRDVNKKVIKELIFSIFIGMILGVYLLKHGNPIFLKKSFGVFILCYVMYSFYKKKKIKIINNLGSLFGFLGGFASGLFNSGGAFLMPYINNKLTKPKNIRATAIAAFAITNFMRVPLIIQNGILTYDIFRQTLVIFPFFLLALYSGRKFYNRVGDKRETFQNILLLLLFLSGLSLILR